MRKVVCERVLRLLGLEVHEESKEVTLAVAAWRETLDERPHLCGQWMAGLGGVAWLLTRQARLRLAVTAQCLAAQTRKLRLCSGYLP